jgi:CO/xanthine dehydrogenase Mo-binding subunit
MGGGFGGRFGVALTHVPAVLLSQKTGRAVKVQMTRHEEFTDGRPAPGCVIKLKTGATQDGKILAAKRWVSGIPVQRLARRLAKRLVCVASIRFLT